MNLAECYAAYCGCKIDLPTMKEEHIDLPQGRYITLHSWCEKETNRRYAHWQEVVDILLQTIPDLTIVQIGENNDPLLRGVISYCGKTNVSQLNYLIKHSTCHVGYDSFPMHIASMHDIPIVSIFRNYIEQSYPAWSSKSKVALLLPELTYSRPPYGFQEPQTAINKIKPIEIIKHITKLIHQ